MNTKDQVETLHVSFMENLCSVAGPVIPYVSRGAILSGVLQGISGFDSVPVMTDTPVSDSEPAIDYNPETDQRLDRFDAVEMGIEAIDEKVPTPNPDGSVEKKE